MKRHLIVLVAYLSSLISFAAQAAPGEYWEVTIKTETAGMPSRMPPSTTRECFRKDEVQNPEKLSGGDNCKTSNVKKTGNKTTWNMRCDQNGEITTGSGEQITSADSYSGKTQMVSKVNGRSFKMNMIYSGKRIGGNCEAE